VERARDGDPRACELLVERHQRAALRIAYAVAGSDADDVVQEAFVKALRNLHRFRSDGQFRPWLLRIVANEASNARRSAGRRRALALRTTPQSDVTVGSPEDDAVLAERRGTVVAALATLPERDRLVIAYRWFADLSETEIAAAMQCRPGTVKSRLSRAHARLRAALPPGYTTSTLTAVEEERSG
jgi:RNA polymerase sigma factor (sigma-70 family)